MCDVTFIYVPFTAPLVISPTQRCSIEMNEWINKWMNEKKKERKRERKSGREKERNRGRKKEGKKEQSKPSHQNWGFFVLLVLHQNSCDYSRLACRYTQLLNMKYIKLYCLVIFLRLWKKILIFLIKVGLFPVKDFLWKISWICPWSLFAASTKTFSKLPTGLILAGLNRLHNSV